MKLKTQKPSKKDVADAAYSDICLCCEFREHLKLDFEGTADWRHELTHRYPHDSRNYVAADELARLAGTIEQVPDKLMERLVKFWNADGEAASMRQSEMMRSVGFGADYKNAAEFLRELMR